MKVKDLKAIIKNNKPDDEIWLTYITKADIKQAFVDFEYTDENDELIEVDNLVTNEVVVRVMNEIDNDDYLWERFHETFNDICRQVLDDLLKDKELDINENELWDK